MLKFLWNYKLKLHSMKLMQMAIVVCMSLLKFIKGNSCNFNFQGLNISQKFKEGTSWKLFIFTNFNWSKLQFSTGWGKRFTIVSMWNIEFILVLLFMNYCITFHTDNCKPTFCCTLHYTAPQQSPCVKLLRDRTRVRVAGPTWASLGPPEHSCPCRLFE